MKPTGLIWFVVTADQRRSRSAADRVPAALALLGEMSPEPTLPFERTAGDEIQCLSDKAETVVGAVRLLTRLGDWRIGIGCGQVQLPLPSSTRESRGPAYLAAREAVEEASGIPTQLALRRARTVAAADYRDVDVPAMDAQTALWLVRHTLERRTRQGWELVDLLDAGLSNQQAAARLGISPSAVSQRGRAAAAAVTAAGEQLAVRLLTRLQEAP